MGVPVVSLAGDTTASRMGLSLLTTLGHPELCAASPDGFVELARRLASDLPRLGQMRQCLRPMLLASPLCDGKAFAQSMTTLLINTWNDQHR